MDPQFRAARIDVESHGAGDDVCRKPHDFGVGANIIVMETARRRVEMGFWDYAKFGIPVTVLTTIAGMIILLLMHL